MTDAYRARLERYLTAMLQRRVAVAKRSGWLYLNIAAVAWYRHVTHKTKRYCGCSLWGF